MPSAPSVLSAGPLVTVQFGMTREMLARLWNDAWDGESWVAPWSRAIDLTPPPAAWSPSPGRHSIWQIVSHVAFWRETSLDIIAGKPKLPPDEVKRRNFPAPEAVTAAAWQQARDRLADSHRRIAASLADPSFPFDRLQHHPYHDAYHLGQIMYLRALQGLPPIE